MQTWEVFEPFLAEKHDPRAPLNTISSGWKITPGPRSLFRQVSQKNGVDVQEPLRVSYKPVYAIHKGNNPT